ncbi:helix-hairpin-helix domain-containing protein [Vagococcus fluvialis]|uniref:Helix-hairpin-helix DNA-binding motif class 1 domain-containing protein n=1 Tax=Vagococcus fluvialis TaxID=2738 RepID=A0A369B3C9_9ENTE|nr:helix-hairpin-helix domain-containing protein [Vagococcus fluvialis]MBO0444419.1 helix-hairpin-helix domain-containing protein [Vagococcus fluvialis]MBO0480230.1 helix-hairpin-helix domain-containing protein [Vagococcus fluvialis]MBO0484987.1 helix-hairpin-helix domain-containing protein [Vagococcus fluvialis]MBO0486346.1 helix-hairpin-helix domain-containing protein [Vagococcus fluvialis]MCM2139220.1 helix-hairpin-helix domain-containing protein [Vagococcus fluvialis]
MESIRKHVTKEKIIISVVILVISIIGLKLFLSKNAAKVDQFEEVVLTDTTDLIAETEKENNDVVKMYVDIKGAVKLPGMYEVTSDMRVLNVIDMAGGLKETADDSQVNFSQRIEDQMVIYIPVEGEELSETAIAGTNSNTANISKDEDGKVNLNQATKEELMTLSGVGEKKAEKIIEYREENGSFKTIEDLKNVNGFGEKSFESLEKYISI